MTTLIESYRQNGFQFVAENAISLDSVPYKLMFFSSVAKGNVLVLVSEDGKMFQEYTASMFHGNLPL